MNAQYRHSQPGYVTIAAGLIMVTAGMITYAYGMPLGTILALLGVFILVWGYKLTVEIRDGILKFWFGPWVFWKNIPLENIAYCGPFKGVIFGWGIHWFPGGWLYNVSGMKAVTIVLKSGKKIHIGTDEPVRLIEAINSALRPAGGDDSSEIWSEIKSDYLGRVEQALSAVRHPRSFEILADIGSHLDQRFAEITQQQRTWETFQKIITEMGPPADYTELVGQQQAMDKPILSAGYVITLVLVLAAVITGLIVLPKVLNKNVIPTQKQAEGLTQHEQTVDAAIEAAESWLKLIDEDKYSESWEQAAEFFKKYVSREQWKNSLDMARKPLGKTILRKVINSTYTTTLPGAPDGRYVVIQFESSFENKQNAVETVTPMLDSESRWRVSGYFIK